MIASLVMPFYGRLDLVHARMAEFFRYLPIEETEIILVDDGSDPEEKADGIVGFWQKQVSKHKIRYLKNEKNMGFGFSMNRGASKATGDILVLFTDDVIIHSNFLPEVSYILAGDDNVLVGCEYFSLDTGWNNFNGKIIPYMNGWMLACTMKAWDTLGGFDPRYGLSDFEDVDLSYTALQKGFRFETLKENKLVHMGGQTARYNAEREARTRQNREKFREKWGL